MTEPLVVDPSRLEIAGATLRALAFPTLPPQIVIAGTDAISGAIRETLPIIEGPVVEGLPAIKAALARTGASISAAADMYADTDQRLGEQLNRMQFFAASQKQPGTGTEASQLSANSAGKPADETRSDQPADGQTPKPAASQINPSDFGQTMSTVGTFAQSVMQSAQGPMSSMSSGGAPAGPASQSSEDDRPPADRDDDQPPESLAEGAAPGAQASEAVPDAPMVGQPETASSGRSGSSGQAGLQ